MSINDYLILAVGVVVLLLIYYIVSRETQQAKQIRAIATAVEKINHQLFSLDKAINHRIDKLQETSNDTMNSADLNYELEVGISEFTTPIQNKLSQIDNEFNLIKKQLDKRISYLEDNMRNLSLPSSVTGMDDDRIISLYKQGVDLDTISKELRLSKAEVEFVLKINQLK
jgi:archaellum component FlaC